MAPRKNTTKIDQESDKSTKQKGMNGPWRATAGPLPEIPRDVGRVQKTSPSKPRPPPRWAQPPKGASASTTSNLTVRSTPPGRDPPNDTMDLDDPMQEGNGDAQSHESAGDTPQMSKWGDRTDGQTDNNGDQSQDHSNAPPRRREIRAPQVYGSNFRWRPELNIHNRRFMIVTENEFSESDCDRYHGGTRGGTRGRTRGGLLNHIHNMLSEALDENAVIEVPGARAFDMVSNEEPRDYFFGNEFAGQVLTRIQDDFEELQKHRDDLRHENNRTEAEKRQRQYGVQASPEADAELLDLGIKNYPHIMVLMAKNLHTRYRTMWQMATNIGLIPASGHESQKQGKGKGQEKGQGKRQEKGKEKGKEKDSFKIDLSKYGEFKELRARYDLCTALAHSGSLRDDLVVGTSKYFRVWQPDGPHGTQRSAVFRRLFEEIYSLDYDTAQWIVTAADRWGLQPAQDWIRIIDRFIYALDCAYKQGLQPANGTGRMVQAQSRRILNDFETARSLYKTWVEELKQLVAVQQGKDPNDEYRLDARERIQINSSTRTFHDQAKTLLTNHWDRLTKMSSPWKPTESLQRDYISFYNAPHDPFGPPP